MANHMNKLTDIYNRWLSKDENKNVSKGSADDVLYDMIKKCIDDNEYDTIKEFQHENNFRNWELWVLVWK